MKARSLVWILGLGALALVPASSFADHDDDDDREEHEEHEHGHKRDRGRRGAAARAAPQWRSYEEECGGCHLAYPPGMLPEPSWRKLMDGLADHFGQNAEVDEATRKELTTFLSSWAGPGRGESPLRITELRWWRHEHDEVSAAVWKRKAVGSQANCGACHPNADQGDFEEDRVKIPRDADPPR